MKPLFSKVKAREILLQGGDGIPLFLFLFYQIMYIYIFQLRLGIPLLSTTWITLISTPAVVCPSETDNYRDREAWRNSIMSSGLISLRVLSPRSLSHRSLSINLSVRPKRKANFYPITFDCSSSLAKLPANCPASLRRKEILLNFRKPLQSIFDREKINPSYRFLDDLRYLSAHD